MESTRPRPRVDANQAPTWRSPTLLAGLAVLSGAALTIAAVSGCGRDASASEAADLHGATAMDQQLKALQPLLEGISPTAVPKGVNAETWARITPKDNALTAERVELGKKLYFDTRLSKDNTVSCATCHDVTRSFTDRRATSEGIRGQIGKRNAPIVLNAALLGNQFWDGRNATVEDQAMMPIINPIEMGFETGEAAAAAIAGDTEYQRLFQQAYGSKPNYPDIGRAIGAFERTLIFLDTDFDDYLAGQSNSVSAEAKRGWILFNGKARCVACHPMSTANPLGTDNRFHNIGVSAKNQDFESLAAQALTALTKDPSKAKLEELALSTDMSELGRFMVSKNYSDIGSFRTPQIRNIGISAPYMHDGSMETLWDVVDHYNKGGEANPYLDGGVEALNLTDAEIDDLVAFLFSLTDKRLAPQNTAEFAIQRATASKNRPNRDADLASRKTLSFDPRN